MLVDLPPDSLMQAARGASGAGFARLPLPTPQAAAARDIVAGVDGPRRMGSEADTARLAAPVAATAGWYRLTEGGPGDYRLVVLDSARGQLLALARGDTLPAECSF